MEKRKLNNEGFSLIELIVVIAIMAILVGAMAPQVTKYIEKSRISSDKQAIGALFTAAQTALADPDVTTPSFTGFKLDEKTADAAQMAYYGEVAKILGGVDTNAIYKTDNTGLVKLSSKAYKGAAVTMTVDSNNAVTISVPTVSGYTGDEKTATKDGFKVTATGCSDNPVSE